MSKIYDKVHELELKQSNTYARYTYLRAYDDKGNEVAEVDKLIFRYKATDDVVTNQNDRMDAISEFIKAERVYVNELTGGN